LETCFRFTKPWSTTSFFPVQPCRRGIAAPHGRSAQVRRLTLAIGRTREPVVWGMKESAAVKYIFLLAVPPTDASNYLSLLSGIASIGSRPEMLARLQTAADARRIFNLLKEIKVRPG
jgi:mannitol/fructose-specific phosphotransferase system IIA component (Ntr-type)